MEIGLLGNGQCYHTLVTGKRRRGLKVGQGCLIIRIFLSCSNFVPFWAIVSFLTPPFQEWFIMRTHNSPQKRQFMKLLRVLKSWQLRQPCDIIVLVKAEFPLLVQLEWLHSRGVVHTNFLFLLAVWDDYQLQKKYLPEIWEVLFISTVFGVYYTTQQARNSHLAMSLKNLEKLLERLQTSPRRWVFSVIDARN